MLGNDDDQLLSLLTAAAACHSSLEDLQGKLTALEGTYFTVFL